jgi:hypothetical protein
MTPRLSLAALLIFGSAAAQAQVQDVGGAWKVDEGRAQLRAAGISLPDRAATLTLVKTGEFSHKGESLDNVAQYHSSDRAIFATAYIYLATYADAALSSYATRKAILERFTTARLESETVVPFAGRADGAIRQIYTGAVAEGQQTATVAGFARIGSWVIKLRATGPADRAAEVTGALDALISGAATSNPDALVYPVAPLKMSSPCPAPDGPAPQLMKGEYARSAVVMGGLLGGSMISVEKRQDIEAQVAFPRNGATPACVRGQWKSGTNTVELLQPAGESSPDVMLALLDDLGTTIAVERWLDRPAYTIKRYAIGEVTVAGTLDRAPTSEQFFDLLTRKDATEMAIRSTVTVKADGSKESAIDPDALK